MTAAPDRSVEQRLESLIYANRVRMYRAQLKRDLYAARVNADEVLYSGDPLLATMKIDELLRAIPGMGPVKTIKILRHLAISPSKTIAGISPRQRAQLRRVLLEHRVASHLYHDRQEQNDAA